jgi:hypothetical protein
MIDFERQRRRAVMSAPTQVKPAEAGKKTSDILSQTGDERTVKMDLQDEKCFWNNQEFSQGTRVETDGKCYECSFGRWLPIED